MNVTRVCELNGLPYTMNPTLPAKFGTLVERLDLKTVMSEALEAASELPRQKRVGKRVRCSDVRKKHGPGLSRMRVFAVHGCKCYNCGLEGTEVLHTVDSGGGHHIDLYAVKDGQYALMNRDHILPASWGGPNHLWNLRPACECCNSNRGNTFTVEDAKLYLHRLRWTRWGKRLFTWMPFLSDRTIYRLANVLAHVKVLS